MNRKIENIFPKIIRISLYCLVAIIIFVAISAKIGSTRCVQLKNGLNLGFNAAFDLRRPYFRRIVIPKFPDGTPLVQGDIWPIYVTENTLYGVALGETGKDDFAFAWRADTGFVRRASDKKAYDRLVSEAGPANVGMRPGAYGTTIVMREFIKRPEYANQSCATKFVTW